MRVSGRASSAWRPHRASARGASIVAVFGLLVAWAPACSIGETNYETVTQPLRVKKETRTCDSAFVTPDLSKLESCGEGKGHCFAAAKLPLPADALPACKGDDVCAPDKLLTAGGKKAKACTFFLGNKPGGCVSILVKDVGAHKDELKQDVCDPDERCAPCVHPVDGTDTHVCDETGAHEAACVGGPSAESDAEPCCHGMGVCMNEDSTPEDSRGDMSRDACPEKKLCAPVAMVDGNPTRCDVLGVSGVCIDLCFAAQLRSAKPLMRGGCGPTEICLPCAIGKGRGMPGCD